MRYRRLGDVEVSAVGLGEMPLSVEGRPSESEALRTIHASLDAGVTLIDTADAYSLSTAEHGHGERLVAKALSTYGSDTSRVIVATKGGHLRPGDGSWKVDGRPEYLVNACENSLRALGVDAIGLYQFHRPDPNVAYADSVGVLAELLDAGKIKMAGVSNATVEQIDEANEILGGRLVSVQNQFSPFFRSSKDELVHCRELGVAFLAWSPLGGIGNTSKIGAKYAAFAQVANARGCSVAQVTLAWILANGEQVIPIPGSSRPETAIASAAAAEIDLSSEELSLLDNG
ncbi:MAG: aldo/keto reductase [Acidimicrobiales bacterium]